ncbi:hypothetical protein ACRJ4W_52245 [Streptomyces sp. GLT-R25]
MFVPVPVESLREALADPARVARAVPGLQQDAGTPPVSGRLKVRVGGHAITYRGALTVTPQDDGTYAVEADATEARGSGTVKLALTLALRSREGDPSGSTVTFTEYGVGRRPSHGTPAGRGDLGDDASAEPVRGGVGGAGRGRGFGCGGLRR